MKSLPAPSSTTGGNSWKPRVDRGQWVVDASYRRASPERVLAIGVSVKDSAAYGPEMTFAKHLGRREITCTVRIWQEPRVKTGGCSALVPGEVVVDPVREILIEQITPKLAERSGFDGVDDLLATAKHGRGERVFMIEFRYEE